MNSYKHTARFALLFIVVLLILIDGIYGSGIFPTLLTGLASLVGIESQGSATFASDLAVEGEVVVPWSADICADCEVRSVRLSGFIDANASGNAVVFLETKKSSLLIFNQTVLLKPIDRGVSAQEQPGVFYFNLRCTDTCVLPESVKEGSLRFQVDSNISLRVTSITYEWAQNPEKDAGEVIPEVPEIQPLEAEALNEPAPEKGVIEPVKTPVNASLEQPALVVNETTGTSKKEGKNVSSAVVKTPRGKVIKVTVSNAPNARKVLAATEIPEVEQSRIALYRTTGGVRETVEFLGYDTNGNELIDRVEWSSVSGTETYEIIIEISAAEHLDAQRGFISDIYDEVNAQDGVWSEEIPDGDFVRVAFEKNLTAARDITIYPRVTSGSPRIEVYEVNGTAKIAEFSSIVSNQYMKVYLAGLDGKQDTFDLRVFDGSVEFDHIIDPEQFFYDNFESGDFAGWDISGLLDFWTLDTVVAIDTTSAKCAAQKNCNNFGMATTGAIDTSAATGVNLTLRFNDDDLDATGDAEVYFLNSTISWVLVGNLNAVTEDTWETFTFTSTNASYLHSGFKVLFAGDPDANENIWIDNVNITALTGSSCPSTLTQNTTLIGDMFAPASCFLFGADNIVLDCNGRSIAWDNAGGGNDFAVWSDNRSNVTVKNCVLIDGNVGGAFSVGINFTRTNNSLVENNTVRTNGTNNNYGIVLQTSAFNNSVLNNTVQANGTAGSNVGIYLFSTVSGNNVSRNNITTNGTSSNQGIRLELSATNNGVFNNTVLTNGTSSGNNGVYLFSTVSNNTVSGNVIVTNGSDNNHGLRLETSANNNTFHDNFITTLANQSYGISLLDSSDNRFNGTILNFTKEWIHGGVGMLNNFSNTTFMTGNGSINSTPLWTLTGLQNITQLLLNITNNTAFSNSSNLTMINTTAQIILKGITTTNPQPIYDENDTNLFAVCDGPQCVEQSYSGSIFVFNVTRFSRYSSNESDCPSTLTQNRTLTRNISANASCFLFGADNIVLDCNGKSITWDTAGSGNDFAVWSDNRSNVTVKNCVLIDGNVAGIFGIGVNFTRTNNSLVENNTVRTNGTSDNYGIYLFTTASNNVVKNNTITTNGTGGTNVGIYLQAASGNNISGNVVTTGGTSLNAGVSIQSSANNNTVVNNTLQTNGTSGSNVGIYLLSTVSGNNVSGNFITTNGTNNNHGIRLETSANNNTFNGNFITTLTNQSYGISLLDSSDNRFNGTILNFTKEWIHSGVGMLNNFSNTTFQTGNGSINSTANWTLIGLQNITQLLLNITNNTAFSNSSNLTIINTTAQIILRGITTTDPQPIYDENDTNLFAVCNSPQCVEQSYSGGIFTFNVTRFSTYSTNETPTPTSCPTTITQNLTLTANRSATASCVLFGADNIVLDCNGYVITWDTSGGGNDFAVWSDNRTNVTVKNCILIDGNVGGARGIGINFTRTNLSLVLNNTVRTNGTNDNYGIVLQTSAFNNTIANNTVRTNGTADSNYGIYLSSTVSGNNVSVNSIVTDGTSDNYGVYLLTGVVNNLVINNNVTTNGTSFNRGIVFSTNAFNNTASNNMVQTNGTGAQNYGIYLLDSAINNTVRNNTIRTNGTLGNVGIYLFDSGFNNTVVNNTINTNGSSNINYGIYLFTNIINNNFTGNVITTNGTHNNHGLRLETSANNNTFHDNFITTLANQSYGISLLDSSDNRFNGTILNFTKEWIHGGVGMRNNFSNTTFMTGNGSINSTANWTLVGLQNITQVLLNITNNTAFSNSSNLTMLNTTAQIKLRGITAINPQPIYDENDTTLYSVCTSPQCVKDGYSSGIFTFNVTRFSTYSTNESFGILNVTLQSPTGINNQPQNQFFTVRANVTCEGYSLAICGNVSGTVRYNATSSTTPNAAINGSNVTGTPFYTVEANPISCGSMNVTTPVCQLNWTVNASGAIGSTYMLDVNFTSNQTQVVSNNTANTTVNIIDDALSITISSALAEVAFGTLSPGTTDNPGVNNSINGYNVTCSYSGGNCNISIRGDANMTDGVNKIGLDNVSWNQANSAATKKRFNATFDIINETLADAAVQLIYFLLDVPSGQVAASYQGNFTIQGTSN